MLTFDQMDAFSRFARENPPGEPKGREDRDLIEQMQKHVRAQPLFARYVNYLRSAAHVRNVEPWHALGEKLLAASSMFAALREERSVQYSVEPPHETERLPGLALYLLKAQTYLWSNHITQIARESPLPPHVVSRDIMPYPLLFWSCETAVKIDGHPDPEAQPEGNWRFLMHHPEGIQIVSDIVIVDKDHVIFNFSGIPYGKRFPDDFASGIEREGTRQILQQLAFLNSPFVSAEQHALPRPIRREIARTQVHARLTLEDPHVVTLRRPAPKAHDRKEGTESREWDHQWWVSGHYRAQWYPSTQSHKVIWVAPYLKGDPDKPVLEKVYRVVR